MDNTEREKEISYLSSVIEALNNEKDKINKKLPSLKQEAINSSTSMWEEAPRGINDFDDAVVLSSYNTYVMQANESYTEKLKELNRINSLLDIPYFGRFDIKEDSSGYESIYIGKYSFFNEKIFDYMFIDWRAPIASVFYEYDIGDVSYMTPNGERKGHINLKRQYKIRDGKLIYMLDTDSGIRDEILLDILSENTQSTLKVIISSIQKEQNTAIRYLGNKYLLVHGPAGSGKTSVGLHRIAYILYKNKDVINSRDIAILSNNNIFNSYISNILPELGEEDVNRYIFKNLAASHMPEDYKISNYYDQANYLMTRSDNERIEEINVKYSYDFLEYIIRYVKDFRFKLFDIKANDIILYKKEDIEEKINNYDYINFQNMAARVYNIVKDSVEQYYQLKKDEIMKAIENQSDAALTEKEVRYLYKRQLNSLIDETMRIINENNKVDEISFYKAVLCGYIKEKGLDSGIYERTIKIIENKRMHYEDYLVYLNIKFLLGKINPFRDIKHVLIDEAQDYNIMQLYFIKNIYSAADFTLLADVNQVINPIISINSYDEFALIFQGLKNLFLHRSYRSTGNINALAFQLLNANGNKEEEFFNREGQKPRFIKTNDVARTIADLIEDKDAWVNTIGIIVQNFDKANSIYKRISQVLNNVQLITGPNNALKEKIVVIPVVLAKGLEFDMVIIADDLYNIKDDFHKRNILYLMCTRALHYLYFISNRPLPGWMDDCKPYLE